ncbi:MAG TPA: hypothetical protein VLD39_13560 [Gammaproteobacteria bacterium]|nr:hypothetical protein [Gammaproteobacteria bacterium]
MTVRVTKDTASEARPERDYLHVSTRTSPEDDTVTLATIQRFIGKGDDIDTTGTSWKVRTLVAGQPMSRGQAMSFATRYAERKKISLVVTDES